jgi:hypothetical protein
MSMLMQQQQQALLPSTTSFGMLWPSEAQPMGCLLHFEIALGPLIYV